MRTAALTMAAGIASFVAVRALLPDPAPADRPVARPSPSAAPVRTGQRTAPAPRTASAPPARDLASRLREEDPHAASVLFEGVDRAVFRLLEQSWLRAQGTLLDEPARCAEGQAPLPATVTVRFDVDAEPALLVVRVSRIVDELPDPIRECLERWLAGEATATDEEVAGAFPAIQAAYERAVPLELGHLVAPGHE